MHLTLLNLTQDIISCRHVFKESCSHSESLLVLSPSQPCTADLSLSCKFALLSNGDKHAEPKENLGEPEEFLIRVSLGLGVLWRVVPVRDGCPWRLYLSKITKSHHRLLILPRRNLASFLTDMPDALPLSSLCLPGTHDTMALYGWPISQCQELSTPLGAQLQSGIRVIDVRLAIIKDRLIAYHGVYPQRTPFQEILSTIHDFLRTPATCQETIVMSIKQEDFAKNSSLDFSRLVHEEIFNGPGGRDMWYLQNRIPALGEVRGKVVLFSRFGGNGEGWEDGLEGLGIHPLTWPDSEKSGFSWQCKDTLVKTHDWYNLPSFLAIPEKVALATQVLLPASNNPPMPILSIAYLSAASFPLAMPPTVAKGFGWPKLGLGVEGINSRFAQWILNHLASESESQDAGSATGEKTNSGPRIRGWALLDFYDEPGSALTPLLVECNHQGRRKGEEGW